MTTGKKTSNDRVARRQGRPHSAAAKVGRGALVSTTREMLRTVSPSRITLTEIASYAGVDRALIRYYFGNKEHLLIAATMEIWDELRTLSRISFSRLGDSRGQAVELRARADACPERKPVLPPVDDGPCALRKGQEEPQ